MIHIRLQSFFRNVVADHFMKMSNQFVHINFFAVDFSQTETIFEVHLGSPYQLADDQIIVIQYAM